MGGSRSRQSCSAERRIKTRLFGPPETIAARIRAYEAVGVDMILCAFLHFTDELPALGQKVIPLFRNEAGSTRGFALEEAAAAS